jgi:hypothetical protein
MKRNSDGTIFVAHLAKGGMLTVRPLRNDGGERIGIEVEKEGEGPPLSPEVQRAADTFRLSYGTDAQREAYDFLKRIIVQDKDERHVDAPTVKGVVIADPPEIAEFLLTMLATTRGADAMIGDLNERFTRECKEFGRNRAVRLYWARALRSIGPLLWRAIGKVVVAVVKRFFGAGAA